MGVLTTILLSVLLLVLKSYGQGTNEALSFGWSQQRTSDAPKRSSFAYGVDRRTKRIVLFGGRTQDGSVLDDTWIYTPQTQEWSRPPSANDAAPHPAGRYSAVFGVDQPNLPLRNYFVISMGRGAEGSLGDTWVLDLDSFVWSRLDTVGPGPSPRHSAAGGIDNLSPGQTDTVMLVSHGFDDRTSFADTFALVISGSKVERNLVIGSWFPVVTFKAPGPRFMMSSVVYPDHSLMMHGGCEGNKIGPCLLNEEYSIKVNVNRLDNSTETSPNATIAMSRYSFNGTWVRGTISTNCPGRRSRSSLAYISSLSRSPLFLMYGGNYGDYAGPQGQVAVLDRSGTWRIFHPGLPLPNSESNAYPYPRQSSAIIPIERSEGVFDIYMLMGNLIPISTKYGDFGFRDSNDVWRLSLSTSTTFREFSQTQVVPCPDVNLVDPQGDGYPKIDANGNQVSSELLPNDGSLSYSSYLLIHSIFLFLAFGIVFPLSALVIRYYDNEKKIYIHGILMTVGSLLIVVGFVFGVLMTDNFSGNHFQSFHSIFGAIVICGCLVSIVGAFFRPDQENPNTSPIDHSPSQMSVLDGHLHKSNSSGSVMMPGLSIHRSNSSLRMDQTEGQLQMSQHGTGRLTAPIIQNTLRSLAVSSAYGTMSIGSERVPTLPPVAPMSVAPMAVADTMLTRDSSFSELSDSEYGSDTPEMAQGRPPLLTGLQETRHRSLVSNSSRSSLVLAHKTSTEPILGSISRERLPEPGPSDPPVMVVDTEVVPYSQREAVSMGHSLQDLHGSHASFDRSTSTAAMVTAQNSAQFYQGLNGSHTASQQHIIGSGSLPRLRKQQAPPSLNLDGTPQVAAAGKRWNKIHSIGGRIIVIFGIVSCIGGMVHKVEARKFIAPFVVYLVLLAISASVLEVRHRGVNIMDYLVLSTLERRKLKDTRKIRVKQIGQEVEIDREGDDVVLYVKSGDGYIPYLSAKFEDLRRRSVRH